MSATITLVGEWSGRKTFEIDEQKLPATMSPLKVGDKSYLVRVTNSDEFEISAIALHYLAKSEVTFSRDKHLLQLRAAYIHVPPLVNQAKQRVLKQLLGIVTPEEVRDIFRTAKKLDDRALIAYAIGVFVNQGQRVESDDLFDEPTATLVNQLIELSKHLPANELEEEHRRNIDQIVKLEERIQARENAHLVRNYFDDTLHLVEVGKNLDQAVSLVTFYAESAQAVDDVDSGELSFTNSSGIKEIQRTVTAAYKALGSIAETRPEVLVARCDPLATALEEAFKKSITIQDKRGRDRPSGFSKLSFELLPGLEVCFYDNQLVLWVSEEKKNAFETPLILKLFEVLKIEKFAVGRVLYDDPPQVAYALA